MRKNAATAAAADLSLHQQPDRLAQFLKRKDFIAVIVVLTINIFPSNVKPFSSDLFKVCFGTEALKTSLCEVVQESRKKLEEVVRSWRNWRKLEKAGISYRSRMILEEVGERWKKLEEAAESRNYLEEAGRISKKSEGAG